MEKGAEDNLGEHYQSNDRWKAGWFSGVYKLLKFSS